MLSARNLNKRFGSLVVAQDLSLELPPGVRYALIGPNGAGKTTLINLLTGMLAPDSGRIFLGGDEITGLKPEARVRQGLARTFQINPVSPKPPPLESGASGGLARERHAHNWGRGLPAFAPAIDEAQAILERLRLPRGAGPATRAPAPRAPRGGG